MLFAVCLTVVVDVKNDVCIRLNVAGCRERNELQSLITTLQEQKSNTGEKSRSATPSTIESDVASGEGIFFGCFLCRLIDT